MSPRLLSCLKTSRGLGVSKERVQTVTDEGVEDTPEKVSLHSYYHSTHLSVKR